MVTSVIVSWLRFVPAAASNKTLKQKDLYGAGNRTAKTVATRDELKNGLVAKFLQVI